MILRRPLFVILIIVIMLTSVYLHGSHKKLNKDQSQKGKNKTEGRIQETDENDDNHDHDHDHDQDPNYIPGTLAAFMSHYNHLISKFLTEKLKNYSKTEQGYIGVTLTSTAPIPIFFLILLFNIKNIKTLDIMSAFAAGALLGDVMLHNLPEIMTDDTEMSFTPFNDPTGGVLIALRNFLVQKETLVCIGVITLFAIEKIISLFTYPKEEGEKHANPHDHHGHSHGGSTQNVIISFIGDVVHNITDGLAIGAAYYKSTLII